MRTTTATAWVIGVAAMVAASAAFASPDADGAAPSATELGIELAAQAITHLSTQARQFIAIAYDRAPTLVLVTGVLLVIPLLALTALAARSVQLARAAQIERRVALDRLSDLAPPRTRTADRWPTEAALVGEGAAAADVGRIELPRARTLVRIGRQDDNDIRLSHKSIHRYHAVVHRTPEGAVMVMDLSGRGGNGVTVNGIRKNEARLADGDLVQLGDVSLRFVTRPI